MHNDVYVYNRNQAFGRLMANCKNVLTINRIFLGCDSLEVWLSLTMTPPVAQANMPVLVLHVLGHRDKRFLGRGSDVRLRLNCSRTAVTVALNWN